MRTLCWIVLAALAVSATALIDGRPQPSELCTTVGASSFPLIVTEDDVCLRLTTNVVWRRDYTQPAIEWHGKRGQLQFSGRRMVVHHPCGRGIYVAGGADVEIFDAAIEGLGPTTCQEQHAILGDYGAAIDLYNAHIANVTTGVFVRGGGALRAYDVEVHDYTYNGVGCFNTEQCIMDHVDVRAAEMFNFQVGIVLGGRVTEGRSLSSFNSMWKGIRINGTGPVLVDDVTVEGPFGLLIEVHTENAVTLRNVRTSASDYYPSHIGVVEAASMTIDGWTARDGDVGLITDYAATVRGISVRNSDVSGMYYGAYMRDSTWNLMLKDNTFATCCVGVYAQVNAHNIIIADTLFENNFVAMDIITPEVVASGNLNTGDGGGMCYYPLRRRRGNVPPAAGAHIEVAEDEPWWIVDHPFTNATVPN